MNVYSFKTAFILVATLFIFQTCKKNSSPSSNSAANPATQNVGNISFSLRTTDMQGNTESHFSVGQNFIPTLTISNSSSQDVTICNCLLTWSNPNFLGVYANTTGKYSDSTVLIGKPWKGMSGYFIASITTIPANSKYEFAIPWVSDTTKRYGAGLLTFSTSLLAPLTSGKYFIQFTFSYNKTPIYLRYNFSIQ
jgi:hypothetical protein